MAGADLRAALVASCAEEGERKLLATICVASLLHRMRCTRSSCRQKQQNSALILKQSPEVGHRVQGTCLRGACSDTSSS